MSVFADSSAIVKLYVAEVGHTAVRRIPAPLVISALGRVEVPAAFWGKHRSGELTADDAALLSTAFEFDYHGDATAPPRFIPVAVTNEILAEAARHAATHGLPAYDAVQLGSALAARTVDTSIDTVAVFDRTLRTAFLSEGFQLATGT